MIEVLIGWTYDDFIEQRYSMRIAKNHVAQYPLIRIPMGLIENYKLFCKYLLKKVMPLITDEKEILLSFATTKANQFKIPIGTKNIINSTFSNEREPGEDS